MDPQQERLFKKVKQGKAVLFVGAGASQEAGLPLSGNLAAQIHQEFLKGTPQLSHDLTEVCTKVLDTPGVDRTSLEEFIRAKLDCQPSLAHRGLCRNLWQAIFTTNYDDLIETAYRTTQERLQRCDAYFGREFSRSQSDYKEVVRLFKLMGCVTGRDEHSQMALSRSDYNRKLRQRGPLFKLLYDFVKDGTVVYIGYSFKDSLARDIIDEVADEVGVDRLPWSWALLPEWDDSTEHLLRQRKILPLQMDFAEFVTTLDAMPGDSSDQYDSSVTVTVLGVPVEIPQQDVTMYDRQFYFLNDQTGVKPSSMGNEMAEKRHFLEGGTDPWLGVRNGWAFRRSMEAELRTKLVGYLGNEADREISVVLMTGPAGSGKTTLARLVSYEIYRTTGIPCLFLHTNKGQVDFLVIDSFVRHLSSALRSTPMARQRLPILIVVDEAAEKLQDLRRLTQYMVSRGLPAVILAVTRENEWKVAQRDRPVRVADTQILSDKCRSDLGEPVALLRHLRSINILLSAEDDDYWVRRIEKEYDNSFQTSLYYLAEPTRPPLTQAIRSEYDRMDPIAQQAYRFVSFFYRFGISIDLELLARSLNHSYEEFTTSVYDPASIGVIIDDQDQKGVIRFRGRSRMVCERIVDYCYPDQTDWLTELGAIVGSLLPQNTNEIDTIRRLLIQKIGPRGTQPFADAAQVKSIFERALDAGMRDSATLHHFALLLLDREEFLEAKYFLTEAIAVIDDERELGHFKTESRQTLYNSMGMISGRHGLHLQLAGKESEASEQFSIAMGYFRSARSGPSPSSYPYYCEAFINYSRARNSIGASKLPFLANALKSLDEAEGNVPDDDMSSLEEMEAKILQYMASNMPNRDQVINDQIAKGNPDGEYLKARINLRADAGESQLETAYAILTKALERTPKHVGCLRLAARLHIALYPDDWEGWTELLNRWHQAEDHPEQCGLLFDLGYASCQLAKYMDAVRYFEQLDQASVGHPRRSRLVKKIVDGQSDRRLSGVIRSVVSPREAWIRCDVVGQDLKCVPILQKFTVAKEQAITFSIGLNYRGLLAVDLRPV